MQGITDPVITIRRLVPSTSDRRAYDLRRVLWDVMVDGEWVGLYATRREALAGTSEWMKEAA